jgi:DNA-binding NarL/FixJ family response regulator
MERLLLVEDPRLFRDGLALLLEWRTGLSSVQVGSLAETKSILEGANQNPACIVVNLDLPEREGIEVLKRLDGIPVLALSKSRNLKRQEEAMRLGTNEVLGMTEPFEKILAAVERLIG